MSIGISRRRWLVSAAIASATVAPVFAERPTGASGKGGKTEGRAAASSMPVPSRTVHLRATSEESSARIVVTAIAADPRGELIAVAGDDHAIRIMKASTLNLVKTLQSHRDVIRTLAFDPAGRRLVSAGNDGQLIFWDCENSFRMIQRMGGAPALADVGFSPDGSEVAAVGFDNRVFLVGTRRRSKPTFECTCHDLRAVVFRGDHRMLAVAGRSGEVHLLDPSDGSLLGRHSLHAARIHQLAFLRDGSSAVSVGEDGCVTLFDTVNQQVRRKIMVSRGKLYAMAVLDSQRVAVAGSDNVIRIVNTDTGEMERQLTGHDGTVASLAVSGRMLFSGGYDATLRRWSLGDLGQSRERLAEGDQNIDR